MVRMIRRAAMVVAAVLGAAVASCAGAAEADLAFISARGSVPDYRKGHCDTAAFCRMVEIVQPVKRAVWTVSGLGVFRVWLNGHEVGADDFLKPGFTHPRKRRHSFSYDVTGLVKTGRNVLAAEVSTGWWRDAIVRGKGRKSAFGASLEIEYEDGTHETIATDESWSAAYKSLLVHAEIYWGEKYDARVDASWRVLGADDWPKAEMYSGFKGVVSPVEGRTIKVRRDLALEPVEICAWSGVEDASPDAFGKVRIIRRWKPGEPFVLEAGETLVIDFAQNASGIPEFTARADAGTVLDAHPAEMLNDSRGEKSRGNDGPAGSAYFANYRKARSTATYIFSGGGDECWHPSATFFGGRYFSLKASGRVDFTSFKFLPVMSIAREDETGAVATGHEGLNRLIANCVWGMRSNYLSVPTDCPQRDERWGWSGDTQVFAGAAVYAADVYGFLSKWMTDMRDSQGDNDSKYPGVFAKMAPSNFGGRLFGWADAGVSVPYTLWRHFGDTAVVKANWDAMARFMEHLDRTDWTTPEGERQCADWLSPSRYEGHRRGWGAKFAKDPFWDGETEADERQYWDMLGACYHIMDLRMMEEMARATGRDGEAAVFAKREKRAVARYRKLFLDHNGRLAHRYRDMQTPNLFPLHLGLFPSRETADAAASDLAATLERGGFRVGTGFLGTPLLLDVLTNVMDAPHLAYSVLLQRECPGWLFSVDQGATTIWERWNGYTKEKGFGPAEMNSFNHYANGAVLGWIYRSMAGMRPGKDGGWRKFVLSPKPDRRVGWCKARYRSRQGVIESFWRYDGDRCIWRFAVPEGTTATVRVNGTERDYPEGEYELELSKRE